MSGKRSHRILRTWILALVLLALATPVSAAARLVHMHNGKVLRAESVAADGAWIVVTLDGGHTLGIPAHLVAQVEDDLGNNNDFGTSPNVVTSGRYVPRGRSAGFSNRQGGRATPKNALTEGSKARAAQVQPGVAAVPGQIRQAPPGMQTQQGGSQATSGVNLTPAAPSRFKRPSNN